MHDLWEKFIVQVLLVLLMAVVSYGTIELTYRILRYLIAELPAGLGRLDRVEWITLLHDTFGAFLLILIGLELIHTVVVYLHQQHIRVEVVISVAIIAVARHAIDVDYRKADPLAIIGIAALVLALMAGYFLFKRTSSPAQVQGD